ncbi:MAG: hypothetical protein EHM42_10525, partial [Planctomycetaceae bacterium]
MSRRRIEQLREERAQERRLRVPDAEQVLIEALADLPAQESLTAGRILCTSLGRGQLAQAAARRFTASQVTCHFLDQYRATEARRFLDASESPPETPVAVDCAADFPTGEFDLVAMPVDHRGEAELTRDLLQQA